MKKLSFIDKIVFAVNTILALITLLSYLSYYVSPARFSFIAFLSLAIPVFIILHILFIIYWIIKFRKQFILSTLILLIGYQYVTKFYQFEEKKVLLTTDIKVMSYNVRMFNLYKWNEDEDTAKKTVNFIKEKDPDILCLQEFHPAPEMSTHYPYEYVVMSEENKQFGHAIYSKYRIINTGSLGFKNSGNNAIFADVIKGTDTLRIYNVHLESLKINPAEETLNQENSERLKKRVETAFAKQADQTNLIVEHQSKSSLKSVLCGDFNNTAYSWPYYNLLNDKQDAYVVSGKGFGNTYNLLLPLRIDFILADADLTVNHFQTFHVDYSDHYPIMARINFN